MTIDGNDSIYGVVLVSVMTMMMRMKFLTRV